jgi:uncharacterized membrane protein
MYEELKFLHVLAIVLLGGTALVDTLAGMMMPRVASVAELRGITRISRVNQFIGIATLILVPVFGYATATDGDLELGSGWLLFGQILFWVMAAITIVIMTPGALRIAKTAQGLADGPVPEDVSKQLNNPIFPVLGILLWVFYVIVIYLMVAKPDL